MKSEEDIRKAIATTCTAIYWIKRIAATSSIAVTGKHKVVFPVEVTRSIALRETVPTLVRGIRPGHPLWRTYKGLKKEVSRLYGCLHVLKAVSRKGKYPLFTMLKAHGVHDDKSLQSYMRMALARSVRDIPVKKAKACVVERPAAELGAVAAPKEEIKIISREYSPDRDGVALKPMPWTCVACATKTVNKVVEDFSTVLNGVKYELKRATVPTCGTCGKKVETSLLHKQLQDLINSQ
jgi:hypothetical protein